MYVDPLTAQKDYLKIVEARLDAVVAGRMSPYTWHNLNIVKNELEFARERIVQHTFLETFVKLVELETATSRLIQDFGK
jgi:queuine/archaeosine tRNA-ribosyltransferase